MMEIGMEVISLIGSLILAAAGMIFGIVSHKEKKKMLIIKDFQKKKKFVIIER